MLKLNHVLIAPFQENQLSGFTVINVLNVDKYHRFVFPSESSFP